MFWHQRREFTSNLWTTLSQEHHSKDADRSIWTLAFTLSWISRNDLLPLTACDVRSDKNPPSTSLQFFLSWFFQLCWYSADDENLMVCHSIFLVLMLSYRLISGTQNQNAKVKWKSKEARMYTYSTIFVVLWKKTTEWIRKHSLLYIIQRQFEYTLFKCGLHNNKYILPNVPLLKDISILDEIHSQSFIRKKNIILVNVHFGTFVFVKLHLNSFLLATLTAVCLLS